MEQIGREWGWVGKKWSLDCRLSVEGPSKSVGWRNRKVENDTLSGALSTFHREEEHFRIGFQGFVDVNDMNDNK